MSYSKQTRTLPIKPKIVLPLRGQCGEIQQTPVGYVSTPYGQSPIIMTPVVSEASVIYNKENNGFVFTQIRGIKDFTKTGLSVGERSAFWLYEKVWKFFFPNSAQNSSENQGWDWGIGIDNKNLCKYFIDKIFLTG